MAFGCFEDSSRMQSLGVGWRSVKRDTQFLVQIGVKRKQGEEGNIPEGSPADMARAFLEQTLGSTAPKRAK